MGARVCRRHICLGKKRGDCVGPTKRGKGSKIMFLVDGTGLPLAIDVQCASPAEVSLIERGPHWDTIEKIECCVSITARRPI